MAKGKLSENNLEQIVQLYKEGYPILQIARAFKVDHSTIHYHLNKRNAKRTETAEQKCKDLRSKRISEVIVESDNVFVVVKNKADAKNYSKKPKTYADYLKADAKRIEEKLKDRNIDPTHRSVMREHQQFLIRSSRKFNSAYLKNSDII